MAYAFHCRCGLSITQGRADPVALRVIIDWIIANHTGEGHGECSARMAAKIREEQENAETEARDGN